jgi:hypothetical protein
MTVQLKKATLADFEKIHPLLTRFRTAGRITKSEWRRIFEIRWDPAFDYNGYMLLDNEQVVGFLGMIFSHRLIRGRNEHFCDLVAWRVEEQYRSESLRLIFPILKEKDLTITTFSAANRVILILRKLGFRAIEQYLHFLLPLPSIRHQYELIMDRDQIGNMLEGEERRIFDCHRDLYGDHALIKTSDGPCYIILNRGIKKRLNVSMVSYLSDRKIFRKYARQFALELCRKTKAAAIAVGGHFGIERLPFSLKVKRRHANLFHSYRLGPEDIDMIFSEMQILGLKPT